MAEKRGLFQSKEEFHRLRYFRSALNAVGSLANFIYDKATELLACADELRRAEDTDEAIECTTEVSGDEVVVYAHWRSKERRSDSGSSMEWMGYACAHKCVDTK